MGIEPTFSAWEADILPLNHTRKTTILLILFYNKKFTFYNIFFLKLLANLLAYIFLNLLSYFFHPFFLPFLFFFLLKKQNKI